jgi:hypothetical protein
MLSILELKRLAWLRKQKSAAEAKYARAQNTAAAKKVFDTLKQIEIDIAELNRDIEALETKRDTGNS